MKTELMRDEVCNRRITKDRAEEKKQFRARSRGEGKKKRERWSKKLVQKESTGQIKQEQLSREVEAKKLDQKRWTRRDGVQEAEEKRDCN